MASNFRRLAALSTLVLCTAFRNDPSSVATKQLELHAYWIRHGLSCANVMQQQALDKRMSYAVKALSRTMFPAYSDPPLTDCAIDRAKVTGPKILDQIKQDHPGWVDRELPILVFSSQMLRAVETALYNFQRERVYPIPHIAEHGPGLDNIPKAWDVSRALRIGDPEEVLEHVTFIKDVNDAYKLKWHAKHIRTWHKNKEVAKGMYTKSHYEAFKRSFPDILRKVLANNSVHLEDIDSSLPIPIVIVSHSGFMAASLACQKHAKKPQRPANNQAWKQVYHLTGDEMEDAGCYEDVLAPEEYGKAPEFICASMVQRCRDGFKPHYLIDADAENCTKHAGTAKVSCTA